MTTATEHPPRVPAFDESLIAQSGEPADVWLVGWRCESCNHLSLGVRRCCGLCGHRTGRLTRLSDDGVLDTWTTVIGPPSYVIGYCHVGDAEDDQRVRVFGPLDVSSEENLVRGMPVRLEFVTSDIRGRICLHHRIGVKGHSTAT